MNQKEAANRRKPHFTEVFPNVDPFTVINLLGTPEIADILFAKYQPPFVKGTSDNSNSQLVIEAKASLVSKGWSEEAIKAAVQISTFQVESPKKDPSLRIEWLRREPEYPELERWIKRILKYKNTMYEPMYLDMIWLALRKLTNGWRIEEIQQAISGLISEEQFYQVVEKSVDTETTTDPSLN